MSKRNSSPARKQPLYRQLVAGLGEEELAASLAGMENPRADRLLDIIFDPAYATLSFGQLCSRVGLSGAEMMRLYCQRQEAVGIMRVAQHLPDLMEDIVLAPWTTLRHALSAKVAGWYRSALARSAGARARSGYWATTTGYGRS
jgi:hypothetical protein